MTFKFLEVIEVSKEFDLYHSAKDLFIELITFGAITRSEKKNVLDNVSLELTSGTSIRIVGENGKGKSTLLKVIVGALTPDTGHVKVQGTMGVILELGAGIDQEITGLQNAEIYYYKLENQKLTLTDYLTLVCDFAELDEYYKLPVKYYSSGMVARLAFSVTMMIKPDIMIIDEALSVGDKNFQKKCINLIKDYLAEGSSLLYVSHAETENDLFDFTYKLSHGKLVLEGN